MESTLKRKILAYDLTFDRHSNGVEKIGGRKFRGDDDARLARGPSLNIFKVPEIRSLSKNFFSVFLYVVG